MIRPWLYNYLKKGADWGERWPVGRKQSPIDLCHETIAKTVTEGDKEYIRASVTYPKHIRKIIYEPKYYFIGDLKGCFSISDGTVYLPAQFHFHAPSEHSVKGNLHDLELHIVHNKLDEPGQLGGIAIFFNKGGPENTFIGQAIKAASQETEIDLMSLFPSCEINDFFMYPGSLTFPSCLENVTWYVLRHPIPMSDAQLKFFTSMWADDPTFAGGNGNNREVMPLNERTVLYHTRCKHS
mmetsp:Transcript_13262/g.24870  ORF Transcript_13262/g.24870 Transcript_13262/m.24870 type:complete len:239 (+) Transcript_13262:1192-1908(+)